MSNTLNSTYDIDLSTWLDTYKPVYNHLDPNASFSDETGVGIMFETFGAELAYVESVLETTPDRVWTYMDSEINDEPVIVSGFHLASRIGYFISEVPFQSYTRVVLD